MKLNPQRDPQRFERAAMMLAQQRSKRAVIAQILADGLKVSAFDSRELNARRDAYFAANMQELIPQAVLDAYRLWC